MTSTLVLERVSRLDDADQLAGRIVRPFLVLMAQVGGKVEEAALPAMQCMAFSVLVSWIFHPMSLAGQIPQVTRQFMKQLTSRMAALSEIFTLLLMRIELMLLIKNRRSNTGAGVL